MDELTPSEYGNRLIGQAAAARAMLRFTEQWTRMGASSDFDKGICHAAETIARWTHERFGIPPEPGTCPCFYCWITNVRKQA